MDRIRQALDRARVERAQPAEAPPGDRTTAPPSEPVASGEGVATTGSFLYTRTRVFTPSAEVLEDNRILNPASAEPAAAAFRMLRTQILQRMDGHGWRSLAIFSPTASDGKTTTAINLAVSLASDHSHSVLLVDFDFKRPTLAARLGLSPEFGADDALTGTARIEDCLYHPAGFERLVVLPARSTLANSSEILAGPRSRDLVNELRSRYPERIVLFDLPPVLSADDALSFAPLVECGLVVVAEGSTRRNDLVRTIELLHKTPLVGTVLNRAADTPSGY
jgi:Mrp family chromosome partitioning ATPase